MNTQNKIKGKDLFVEQANLVHKGKYDYSKVEYINSKTKVCIICPEHGEFWQEPSSHLRGRGCPKCGGGYKYNNNDFITKAHEVHGDWYDYSKVLFEKVTDKVCIICPEHGEFWQTPALHLRGSGCKKCASIKLSRLYTKNCNYFITKAKEIHGDKYDYSKVEYVTTHTKVCIICPEHGEFWQTPAQHLRGRGCPKCANIKRNYKLRGNIVEFVIKARKIHGDRYDYSKVNYINAQTKVCIICPEHGEFWQTPAKHLSGAGCAKCGGGYKYNNNDFITKAKEIHGDKYDYSKVNYINSQIKVCIICPEHGEFWQTPALHLRGNGCPICGGRNKLDNESFVIKAREIHGDRYDYSKVEYINNKTKVCILCPEHGEFWQIPALHLRGSGCPICNKGYNREYKFNLLEEFIDEFRLRDFLMTNDENLIYVILRNIEKIDPKFNPIVNDIDRVLRSDSINPIEELEDKYRTLDESVTVDTVVEENNTTNINDIDLDDDDAVEAFISNTITTVEKTEPTIDELTRARENEINLINSIEHMLTPEDRQFIKDKFLNDKRRNWMLERDKK